MEESIQTKWIVSKRFDLIFFICPVIMTPLLFLGYLGIKDGLGLAPTEASTLIYAFFLLLFDQAHIFQTFSRSHFDSIEFKRHRLRHLIAPVLIIGLGPLYWYLDYSDTIYFVFIYYGMWHIWRQNMGLLKVYRGLHKDYAPIDTKIDMSFYWLLFWTSLLPDLMEQAHTIIPFLNVSDYADSARWGLYSLMLAATLTFYARQLYRHKKGMGVNIPKLLFVTMTGAHYFLLYGVLDSYFVLTSYLFVALDTLYHDIQYQGWMTTYQKRRFPEKKKMIGKWLKMSYIYAFFVFGFFIAKKFGPGPVMDLIQLMIVLVVFYHYYVDGIIWRFRESSELQALFTNPEARANQATPSQPAALKEPA